MATQKFIQYYLSKIHELKDEKMLEKKNNFKSFLHKTYFKKNIY